jgi:hypothetical protein
VPAKLFLTYKFQQGANALASALQKEKNERKKEK